MGFFDKILKGLGFEGEEKQPKKVNQEPKQEKLKYNNVAAEYDLSKIKQKQEPKKFVPKSQIEVQEIVDSLKDNDVICCDLTELSSNDYMRGLDFISGAIYYTGGKIQKLGDKIFYLYVGDKK